MSRGENGGQFLFVLNHSPDDVVVPARGIDLLTGTTHDGGVEVPAYGTAVLREG